MDLLSGVFLRPGSVRGRAFLVLSPVLKNKRGESGYSCREFCPLLHSRTRSGKLITLARTSSGASHLDTCILGFLGPLRYRNIHHAGLLRLECCMSFGCGYILKGNLGL